MKKLSMLHVVVAMCASLSATTIIPISVEKLSDISSDVVVAHATRSWSSWNSQHSLIVTYTEFMVDSRLKGSGSTTITVKQPGAVPKAIRSASPECIRGAREKLPCCF